MNLTTASPKRHSPPPERAVGTLAPERSTTRAAAKTWSRVAPRERVAVLKRFRSTLADEGIAFAAASGAREADVLSSEILPLASACRFLEKNAARILKTRKAGSRGRPIWLRGVRSRVERAPHGTVLIIAPSNYPLLLPGVSALQAIAAGNAVALKPGAGGTAAALALANWCREARLPNGLFQVLDESRETGKAAVAAGFDKIVFTGSADTGRKVLATAAATLTPTTAELSGCDAVFVLPGADLSRAAKAIAFGLTFNASCTCIAPRRIFAHRSLKDDLAAGLVIELKGAAAVKLDHKTRDRLSAMLDGVTPLVGGFTETGDLRPAIIDGVTPNHPLANADLFAPVASILPFDRPTEAADSCNSCRYALGASIFGPERDATELAGQLEVGGVTINDLIVPTADPRLPFGGCGESGFGVTRGAEGLLGMTRPRVVSTRRGKSLPHLDEPHPSDAQLLGGLLRASHAKGIGSRLSAVRSLLSAARQRHQSTNNKDS